MPITHAKVSQAVNSTDPNLIQPSDWNAAHVFAGNLSDNITFTGTNTHSGSETFSGGLAVTGGTFSTTQQLSSSLATGTAPFSVASTTLVTNLNAQLLNGQTGPASTVVGISDSQTLTNKTLTSPTITSPTTTGTDTGTETLTNKTLTAPVLTTPTLGNVASVGGVSVVGQGVPGIVYNTASASTNASISAVTMITASGSGNTYRFSAYTDQTVLGASCAANSTAAVNIIFTDPNTSSTTTSTYTTLTIITNGTVGTTNTVSTNSINPAMTFRAKASTAVQYSVTFTPGGSCSPAPSYQVYPLLEQLA